MHRQNVQADGGGGWYLKQRWYYCFVPVLFTLLCLPLLSSHHLFNLPPPLGIDPLELGIVLNRRIKALGEGLARRQPLLPALPHVLATRLPPVVFRFLFDAVVLLD